MKIYVVEEQKIQDYSSQMDYWENIQTFTKAVKAFKNRKEAEKFAKSLERSESNPFLRDTEWKGIVTEIELE